MISRLTACATAFALAGTAALAVTAQAQAPVAIKAAAPVAATVRIIELPRVTVIARRSEFAGQ